MDEIAESANRRLTLDELRHLQEIMSANSNNVNSFPGFLDTSGGNNVGSSPRSSPSPTAQHAANQVNGNGIHSYGATPLPAGHESDLQYLYQGFLALSEQLKQNRELTNGIVRSAEEVMVNCLSKCYTDSATNCLIAPLAYERF